MKETIKHHDNRESESQINFQNLRRLVCPDKEIAEKETVSDLQAHNKD